jgi:hypothetical protein
MTGSRLCQRQCYVAASLPAWPPHTLRMLKASRLVCMSGPCAVRFGMSASGAVTVRSRHPAQMATLGLFGLDW